MGGKKLPDRKIRKPWTDSAQVQDAQSTERQGVELFTTAPALGQLVAENSGHDQTTGIYEHPCALGIT